MVRPYRGRLTLAIVLSLGAMVGVVAVPLLIGDAVNQIDDKDRSGLVRAALALAGVGVVVAISQGARQWVAGKISLDVEYDLRNRFYGHLQDVDLRFLQSEPVGQLVSRGTVDLRQIQIFLGPGLSSLAQDLGTILLAAVVMFLLDADMAALALSPVPLIIGSVILYQRAAVPRLHEVRRRIGVLATLADENIAGVRLVRAFVRKGAAVKRYRTAAREMLDAAIDAVRVQAIFAPTMTQLPMLGLIAVLLYGGHQTLSGSISVGEFTIFYTYVLLLVAPAQRIAYWMVIVQEAIAGAARIDEILDHPKETSAPRAEPLPAAPGSVSLRAAGVRYPGAGMVLDRVDLDVPPKSTVAIVGACGCGKSTLLALINRLYDADAGVVEVAGRPVPEIELSSLRRATATAVDDDFLFSFSVRENIAYGRPDAGDDEVREAARRAQADRFITQLPQGYDTPIGARGLGLSGGQRQRIALARALLTKPRIMLLDNATCSLDAHTEAEALGDLSHHLHECTMVMVAYRIPSLRLADEVVVMDRGQIVARGTHAELMATSERYRGLVGGDTSEVPS